MDNTLKYLQIELTTLIRKSYLRITVKNSILKCTYVIIINRLKVLVLEI